MFRGVVHAKLGLTISNRFQQVVVGSTTLKQNPVFGAAATDKKRGARVEKLNKQNLVRRQLIQFLAADAVCIRWNS